MLSKIVTGVNWRILTFLIEREASLSDIARETGTTKANTFHTLKKLESYDILRKKIQGRTHIYRFNFLHTQARSIINLALEEKAMTYNKKLKNLPVIIHTFLFQALKVNYMGCIFFGSSITGTFKDIDIFVILKEKRNTSEIEKKIKLINNKISVLFGSEEEFINGIKNQDMLYKNILGGIPFGLDIISIKYQDAFLKKEDIKERFMIGYREVLSCLEFKEKTYRRTHLEKGIMDMIYAILNYFDLAPRNDKEAISLFKINLKNQKPETIKGAVSLAHKYSWML